MSRKAGKWTPPQLGTVVIRPAQAGGRPAFYGVRERRGLSRGSGGLGPFSGDALYPTPLEAQAVANGKTTDHMDYGVVGLVPVWGR